MPLTQFYHTRDPIENLRVHVTLRKIASAAGEDTTASSVGTTWDYCFRWQEKKLAATKIQAPHRSDDASSSSVLCSYIDVDNYVPLDELTSSATTTAAGSGTPTHLAGAQHRRLPHTHGLAAAVPSQWQRNMARAWQRRDREESVRWMHLVASLDDSNTHVLCSLRYCADTGLLSATPGFSVPIDVDKEDAETIARKGGPKLSTHSIAIAGALFEYTLDNVNDVMPLAAPQDALLLRELQLREHQQDEARVAHAFAREGRGNSSGSVQAQIEKLYYNDMRSRGVVKRRLVFTNVVSARGLQACEPVVAELQLRLPPRHAHEQLYWQLRTPVNQKQSNVRVVRSRRTYVQRTTSGDTTAVFNLHAQFDLELCSASNTSGSRSAYTGRLDGINSHLIGAPGSGRTARGKDDTTQFDVDCGDLLAVARPVLALRVYSRDAWGRQHSKGAGDIAIPAVAGHDDCTVALAAPVLSVSEQLEELFLGADETSDDSIEQLDAAYTTLHGVNSRLGVHVQATGAFVRVRTNIVDQSAVASQSMSNSKCTSASAPIRPHALPELRVVKRSVNEILQSVRLEKRLQQTTSSSGGSDDTQRTAASTVESVLARLHAVKAASPVAPLTSSV